MIPPGPIPREDPHPSPRPPVTPEVTVYDGPPRLRPRTLGPETPGVRCLKVSGHYRRKREILPLDDWVSPEFRGFLEIIQALTSGFSTRTGRWKTFSVFGKVKRGSLEIEGVKSRPRKHVIGSVEGERVGHFNPYVGPEGGEQRVDDF